MKLTELTSVEEGSIGTEYYVFSLGAATMVGRKNENQFVVAKEGEDAVTVDKSHVYHMLCEYPLAKEAFIHIEKLADTKEGKRFDQPHIEKGQKFNSRAYSKLVVGQCFICSSPYYTNRLMKTAVVKKILPDGTFYTKNSIYKIKEIIKDESDSNSSN